MFNEQVVRRWDLLSEEQFGLFKSARLNFGPDWDREDEKRCRAFASLPSFEVRASTTLRTAARTGIPNNQRRKWWLVGSGGFELLTRVGDVWGRAKTEIGTCEPGQIELCMPINILTFLPSALAIKVKMFCQVLWLNNPGIEFAPLIPTSAALLLLFMETPLAYISIQALINRSNKDGFYFTLSRKDLLASTQAFREILQSRCSGIVKHADS